jgi:hypothetical protein
MGLHRTRAKTCDTPVDRPMHTMDAESVPAA